MPVRSRKDITTVLHVLRQRDAFHQQTQVHVMRPQQGSPAFVYLGATGLKGGNWFTNWFSGKKIRVQQSLLDALKANRPHDMVKEGTLNLCSQSFAADDIKLLAVALAHNTTVTTLWLDKNNVGDDGADSLAQMLTTNKTLKRLDLEECKIYDGGGSALAKALKSNKTLEALHLYWNSIGDLGAFNLAESLQENDTLRTLNLKSNSIYQKGLEALQKIVATRNRTIQDIQVEGNKFGGWFFDFVSPTAKLTDKLEDNQKAAYHEAEKKKEQEAVLKKLESIAQSGPASATNAQQGSTTQSGPASATNAQQGTTTQSGPASATNAQQGAATQPGQGATTNTQQAPCSSTNASSGSFENRIVEAMMRMWKKSQEESSEAKEQAEKAIKLVEAIRKDPVRFKKLEEVMEGITHFMERHATTLEHMAVKKKAQYERQKRLKRAFQSKEGAKEYAEIITQGMYQLYLSALIGTGDNRFFDPRGNNAYLGDMSTGIKVVGFLMPVVDKISGVFSSIFSTVDQLWTQKNFRYFQTLIGSDMEMKKIIEGVVETLVLSEGGETRNGALGKQHLERIIVALLGKNSGEKLSKPKHFSDYLVGIRALANIAEGKQIDTVRPPISPVMTEGRYGEKINTSINKLFGDRNVANQRDTSVVTASKLRKLEVEVQRKLLVPKTQPEKSLRREITATIRDSEGAIFKEVTMSGIDKSSLMTALRLILVDRAMRFPDFEKKLTSKNRVDRTSICEALNAEVKDIARALEENSQADLYLVVSIAVDNVMKQLTQRQ